MERNIKIICFAKMCVTAVGSVCKLHFSLPLRQETFLHQMLVSLSMRNPQVGMTLPLFSLNIEEKTSKTYFH